MKNFQLVFDKLPHSMIFIFYFFLFFFTVSPIPIITVQLWKNFQKCNSIKNNNSLQFSGPLWESWTETSWNLKWHDQQKIISNDDGSSPEMYKRNHKLFIKHLLGKMAESFFIKHCLDNQFCGQYWGNLAAISKMFLGNYHLHLLKCVLPDSLM